MSTQKKTIIWIILIIILLGLANILAGMFVLLKEKQDILSVSFSTYYNYWHHYGDDPAMNKILRGSGIGGFIVAVILPVFGFLLASNEKRSLFGDARFATQAEVKGAGLVEDGSSKKPGIIIGKFGNFFLVIRSTLFVLLAAATRSGKGVSTVIPNLLSWWHSVIVMDIKKENWRITSGYRRKYGQECHLFDPFTETAETSRYNPFYYAREGDFRVADLISIGEIFYPSSNAKDSFWDDQARNLFVGLSLFVAETPALPFTIGEVLRQSTGKGQATHDYLQDIINERNFREVEELDTETGEVEIVLTPLLEWDGEGLPPLSMECVDMLSRFLNTSDNTRSSILASFNAPLLIWSNPIVDAATSGNDFDLREIRRKRISIFIGVNPNRLSEAGRLINVLMSQLINLNLNELPEEDPSIKYQCLLLLDEMTAMGTINILNKANAYIAGYWLRLLTIIQNNAQLQDDPPRGYGKQGAQTYVSNHAVKVVFATKEPEDAEDLSKMLGTSTVKNKGTSRQSGKSGGGRSINESDHGRALLMPQEIREIGQENEIIITENIKPIFCKKIFYYKEPVFINRLKEVSPSLAALGKKLPSEDQLKSAMMNRELSAPTRLIDLATHKARIQNRMRPLDKSDVENGIDINKLAIDTSSLRLHNEENPSPDDIEDFVNKFFNQLSEGVENKHAAKIDAVHSNTEEGNTLTDEDAA